MDQIIEAYHIHLSKILTTPNAKEGMRRFGNWNLVLNCDIEDFFHVPESTQWGHPLGIIIGRGVRMGERCVFRQGVTIGEKYRRGGPYPTLGHNVDVGAGTIIIGDCTIGDNVLIGAGTFINRDVPSNSIVYTKKELVIKEKK